MVSAQPTSTPESTSESSYAHRLQRLSARGGTLRRFIDPQRPYRWNLRRLRPGFVLDVGCGIGRNLKHLDGNGVGVDHNADCIAACRSDGLTAFTTDQFPGSADATDARFDSILLAHVIEHMSESEAVELIDRHLRYLRPDGRIIVITPQERGQQSDPTHVTFIDEDAIRRIAGLLHLHVVSVGSFPFPRMAGRVFTHNESVSVLRRRAVVRS